MVSPEIETVIGWQHQSVARLVARERWSRLRLKRSAVCAGRASIGVARERWSRLRLKQDGSTLLTDDLQGGKGAVVSPEIETYLL